MPSDLTFYQCLRNQPMHTVWRYLAAALFGGIAIGWYVYSELPSEAVFVAERWGKSVTSGVTFGVFFGLVVLFAAEIPERLWGFWPWWSRLILSVTFSVIYGALLWIGYALLILYIPPEWDQLGSVVTAGAGMAAAFALGSAARLPAWLVACWAAVMFYLPLDVTWAVATPLIYTRSGEDIRQYATPIAILFALGAYAPRIITEARQFWRRYRSAQQSAGSESHLEEVER
ncbi:MAG: hypothetical protein ABI700_02345 [Chloroflexota bacterium]